MALSTAFWSTLVILASLLGFGEKVFPFLIRTWSRQCLWFGRVRLQVEGLEQIQPNVPYIIVGNHQGFVDILVMSAILPIRFAFVSKKEVFRVPILNWAMRAVGIVGIDRNNKEKAIQSMSEVEDRIRSGISVGFFPEGTRSLDGKLKPFKGGAFHVAVATHVPVLPIVLIGSGAILPKGSRSIRPGLIRVKILPPVPTETLDISQKDEIKSQVWHGMNAALTEA